MEQVEYKPMTAEERANYMRKLQYMAEAILDRVEAPKLGFGKDNYSREQRIKAMKIASKYLKEEEFKDKTPDYILEYLEAKERYRKKQAAERRKELREIIGKRGERTNKQEKLWQDYKAAKLAMKEAKKKFNMAINETDKSLPIYFKVKEKEDPLAGAKTEEEKNQIRAQIREEKKIERDIKAIVKKQMVEEIEHYGDLDNLAKKHKEELLGIAKGKPTYTTKEKERQIKRVPTLQATKTGILGLQTGPMYGQIYKTVSQQIRAEYEKEKSKGPKAKEESGIPKEKQESGIPKAKQEAEVDLTLLIADLKAKNIPPYSIMKTIEDRGFVLSEDLKNQLITQLVSEFDTSTMKYK